MTFPELARTLPNGLHDADLLDIEVSFERGVAALAVRLDVGTNDEDNVQLREATVRLVGIRAIVIEGPNHQWEAADSLDISNVVTSAENYPAYASYSHEVQKLFLSLFVGQWNSYIHIAAESAEIEWTGQQLKLSQ